MKHNFYIFVQYTVNHCYWWLEIGKIKQLFLINNVNELMRERLVDRLGRTATEHDWRCHRPVAQTPAWMRSG